MGSTGAAGLTMVSTAVGVPWPTVSYDAMPPDPFADDPNDPARELHDLHGDLHDDLRDEVHGDLHGALGEAEDPTDVNHPLDEEQRQDLREDLSDLTVYQALLEPCGVRGVVVDCGDCEQPHFHDWELLRASLRQLLESGDVRPHEPAYEPDPDHYVTWEYCRGYADGVNATENAPKY